MLNQDTNDYHLLFGFNSNEEDEARTEYELYETVQDWKTIMPVASDAVGVPRLLVESSYSNVFYLLSYVHQWNGKRSKKYRTALSILFRTKEEHDAYQKYSVSRDRVAKIENLFQ